MTAVQPPTREQIAGTIDAWWEGTDPDGVMAEDVEALKADLFALFPQPTPVDPDDEFVAPYEMRERGVREQPTLSAEPMVPLRAVVAVMDHYDNGEGECEPEDRWRLFRDMRSLFASDQVIRPAAEPVSIADMAPGVCPECGEHALSLAGKCVACDYHRHDEGTPTPADMASGTTPGSERYRSILQVAEGSTFRARQHGDPQERFWFLAAGMGVVSLDAIMAHANSIDPSTIRDVTPPPATPEEGR